MKWWQIKKRDADLERELRSDLELEEEEQRENGLLTEEARYAARRAFGNTTLIKEQTREAWGWTAFERLGQDVRYALRQLQRSPAFTCISLLTLSLGIGANSAVFSVIQAVLLRPLPFHDPSRLVFLADPQDPQDGGILLKDIEAWRSQSRSLDKISACYRNSGWSRVALTGSQEPIAIQGAFVSADLFPLLGIAPQLGRTFTGEEEARHENVAVLSYGLWQRRFGGSPDVIGQTIHLDGVVSTVIGVMPAAFQFPSVDSQLWAPITTNRYWADPAALVNDGSHGRGFYARWQAVARLRKDVNPAEAQAELNTIFSRLEKTSPDPNRGVGIKLVPLRVQVNGDTRLELYVLFASAALLLLIACGNVANLILARGVSRRDEFALREALGATGGRIVRQLLTEALVLAILAGLFSLPCAFLGTRALTAVGPANIPRLQQAGINPGVLGFTFVVVLICAVFCALAPAITLWRENPAERMKQRVAAIAVSGVPVSTRSFLIIFELALSVVLLTCTGLLIHSFLIVRAVDPGFEAEHVLRINVSLSGGSSTWPAALYDTVVSRLQAVPGVKAVGAIDSLFDLGATNNLGLRAIEGRAPEPRSQWTALTWDTVRGDFFAAIGAQLVRGRFFSDADHSHSPLVAVIDESMANRYWPNVDSIGKRFKGQDRRGQNDNWLTVIGVVREMHTHGLERTATPHVYEWYRQSGNATADILVRTAGEPNAIAGSLRSIVRSVDPNTILSQMTSVNRQLQQQLAPRRFQTALLAIFSILALLLATVGIYGLMHFSVAQRTREIGIRMALGADRSGIVTMIVRESLILSAAGLGLGLTLDWFATRALSRLLYGVTASDPLTLLPTSLLLLAASALASFQPAFKAASVDPILALRSE